MKHICKSKHVAFAVDHVPDGVPMLYNEHSSLQRNRQRYGVYTFPHVIFGAITFLQHF